MDDIEGRSYDPVTQYGGALLRVLAIQSGKEFHPISESDIKLMSGVLPKPGKQSEKQKRYEIIMKYYEE